MNIKVIAFTALGCTLLFSNTGCKSKKQDTTPITTNQVTTETNNATTEQTSDKGIVCLYEKLSLKDKPSKDGKYTTVISRGETITDLNESFTDESDKKPVVYYKVRLSDGQEGWAPASGIKKNAIAAVFTVAASVYTRPDPLTITDQKMLPMNFVAIVEKNDDWAKVVWAVGYSIKEGWVKISALTTSKEEVASAIIITRKLDIKDKTPEIDKMKSLIADAPYPNSIFIAELRKKVDSLQGDTTIKQPDVSSSVIMQPSATDTITSSVDSSKN